MFDVIYFDGIHCDILGVEMTENTSKVEGLTISSHDIRYSIAQSQSNRENLSKSSEECTQSSGFQWRYLDI